jgi:hypothetical protein
LGVHQLCLARLCIDGPALCNKTPSKHKTIFTLIALCVAYSSFAQIEKGRSYLAGEIDRGSSKSDYHNQLVTGPIRQSTTVDY